MYVVKYQDIYDKEVRVFDRAKNEQEAIETAKKIRKNGRWVIVFDEDTGKQVYNERD